MIKFKDSTREVFTGLKMMHNDMPRRWKVTTWSILTLLFAVLIANMFVGNWYQVLDTFCFAALFALCSLYSMTIASMLKVVDEQENYIKAQSDLIKDMLAVLRGK